MFFRSLHKAVIVVPLYGTCPRQFEVDRWTIKLLCEVLLLLGICKSYKADQCPWGFQWLFTRCPKEVEELGAISLFLFYFSYGLSQSLDSGLWLNHKDDKEWEMIVGSLWLPFLKKGGAADPFWRATRGRTGTDTFLAFLESQLLS